MCKGDTNDLSKVQAVNSPAEAEQPEKTKMLVCQLLTATAGEWPLETFKPVGVKTGQSSLMVER